MGTSDIIEGFINKQKSKSSGSSSSGGFSSGGGSNKSPKASFKQIVDAVFSGDEEEPRSQGKGEVYKDRNGKYYNDPNSIKQAKEQDQLHLQKEEEKKRRDKFIREQPEYEEYDNYYTDAWRANSEGDYAREKKLMAKADQLYKTIETRYRNQKKPQGFGDPKYTGKDMGIDNTMQKDRKSVV